MLIGTITKRLISFVACLPFLTACTISTQEEGLKIRTQAENEALVDSWYPIQSEECQLLVDSFGLISVAMGNGEMDYLMKNADEVKKDLLSTSIIVPPVLLELAQTTNEPSIKEYALEAIPIFTQLTDTLDKELNDFDTELGFLEKLANLTGRVPDACKS
jgi:hypothetical protein